MQEVSDIADHKVLGMASNGRRQELVVLRVFRNLQGRGVRHNLSQFPQDVCDIKVWSSRP